MSTTTAMTTSAEVVHSVTDLLIKILLCLPVKSLMRFKSVSTNWKRLITSSEFILMRNPHPNPVLGLIYPKRETDTKPGFYFYYVRLIDFGDEYDPFDDEFTVDDDDELCIENDYDIDRFRTLSVSTPNCLPLKTLSFRDNDNVIRIKQSCNGLLLCSTSEGCRRSRDHVRAFYVHNQTTRCFTKLPTPTPGVGRYYLYLAYDGTNCTPYTIVSVRGLSSELCQVETYSPEVREWRAIGEPFKGKSSSFDTGVYCNGSVYWIISESVDVFDLKFELWYFDVKEGRLGKTELPAEEEGGGSVIRKVVLLESGGYLHLVERCDNKAIFNVYEMKRDRSGWFVKYRVDLNTVSYAINGVYCNTVMGGGHILALIREKEGCAYLVLHMWGRVVKLNLESNTCEMFDCFLEFTPTAFKHIESLACV